MTLTPAVLKTIILALACVVAATLVVSSQSVKAAEARARKATTQLDSVTLQLDNAKALASAGLIETAAYRARIDSLWSVIRTLQYQPPVRQRTVRVVDVHDAQAVVEALVIVTAERDTAVADVALLLTENQALRTGADALRIAALEHLREDSTRFAAIGRVVDSAAAGVHDARATLRRPWWKKAGTFLKETTVKAAIGGIGYVIGRVS